MSQENKKGFTWFNENPKKTVIGILIIILFLIISTIGGKSDTTNISDDAHKEIKKDFGTLARDRFNEIQNSSPELDSITCEGDCNSVAYFNYNRIPEDLEFIVRSNTATYSNFKLKETGTSHVSIFARLNGKALLQCDGSKGVVDSCK